MKSNNSKTVALGVVLFVSLTCWAQDSMVGFSYDNCGNRIRRSLLFKKAEENGRNVEKENTLLSVVNDQWESFEISLYPNPTEGRFTVALSDNRDEKMQAELSTLTGVIIETYVFNKTQHDFNLTGKPSGIYLLKLTIGDETMVWKIIKP